MKKVVIVLAAVIFILLGVLLFVPSAKGPALPSANELPPVLQPVVSADGHLAVLEPTANVIIASPIMISGTVNGGGWFFEASFPVKVLDGNGKVLGQGPAQA